MFTSHKIVLYLFIAACPDFDLSVLNNLIGEKGCMCKTLSRSIVHYRSAAEYEDEIVVHVELAQPNDKIQTQREQMQFATLYKQIYGVPVNFKKNSAYVVFVFLIPVCV